MHIYLKTLSPYFVSISIWIWWWAASPNFNTRAKWPWRKATFLSCPGSVFCCNSAATGFLSVPVHVCVQRTTHGPPWILRSDSENWPAHQDVQMGSASGEWQILPLQKELRLLAPHVRRSHLPQAQGLPPVSWHKEGMSVGGTSMGLI